MKKFYTELKEYIKEEWLFILFIILTYFILQINVNYYIITGGGISDVSSRIKVAEKYSGKGSFNISYVTELQGTIFSYLLSYVIPTWERENADLYKYSTNESIEDIEFRSDLDLQVASNTATYWAYHITGNKVEETSSKLYVITSYEKYKNPLKVGDEIVSIDNKSFKTVKDYRDYFQTKEKGDSISIKVIRNDKEIELESILYEEDNYRILGVGLQKLTDYQTSPKVSIKFKRSESGPSGGLITALEIYNQLTKKDITKGYRIAGTGTIEEDGTIGQIGGVEHKILGASAAKADYFLLPSGKNYEDGVKYVKEKKLKIKLIEVKTIEDAINKLEALK